MKKIFPLLSLTVLVVGVAVPGLTAQAASANDLVKCADSSAVYYLAEDGDRYVFPNEDIYFSWYPDFHDVKTVSCADLATLPLGDRIVYQAGTRLVKIPSDPSVFAVEDDGLLREIPSEVAAIALFGEDWSERVDDVSEAFWPSFTVGAPLAEDEVPEGTILEDDNGSLFRVEDDGTATEIDPVLTIDQEAVLEHHALSMSDVEEQLGLALALTRVSSESAIAVLEELIARLRTISVDDDEVEEVEDFDEVEDEDSVLADVEDAIEDAEEEIAEAEGDIVEDAADGKDITASEALLVTAREHLAAAVSALAAEDLVMAEEHADEARHDAMWARGKAVDSLVDEEDDEDLEDEMDEEDATDDDATDTDEDDEIDETEADDSADDTEDTEDDAFSEDTDDSEDAPEVVA